MSEQSQRSGRHDAGKIPCPNLKFGGANRSRMFICMAHNLLAIYANVRGAQHP